MRQVLFSWFSPVGITGCVMPVLLTKYVPLLLQPCFGRCLLLCSMTTAVTAHLVVLANENGGGFNVRPGQQQVGGTVKKDDRVFSVTLQMHMTFGGYWTTVTADARPSLPGPSSGHPVWPGGGCMPGALLWGPPGCQAGLFFPGWHGPRKHEGFW